MLRALTPQASNRVRVTDFGLASVLQTTRISEISKTSEVSPEMWRTQLTRGIVGTPLYMAPEQWRGGNVSEQTDMYALGCVLFEMLTGEHAVDGRSLEDLQQAHTQGTLRSWGPGVPEAARSVGARCLRLIPGERYANWGAVEQALSAGYTELTGQSAPPPEQPQTLARVERIALGFAITALGSSYVDIGQAEVARGYFERARAAGAAEGERRLEGYGLMLLGEARRVLHDDLGAIGYAEQALAIVREIGDRHLEATTLCNLGIAYENSDTPRAIGYFEQALVISREIGDRSREGPALACLGSAYRVSDGRRAIGYYEQSLTILREIGDLVGQGRVLGNLGTLSANFRDHREAIGYHEQALPVLHELGDPLGEALVLANLGKSYLGLGDARRAIGYCEQSLTMFREIGDRAGQGRPLGSLGVAYDVLGDARRAIDYFEQALVVAREVTDLILEELVLANLGGTYLKLGDVRRAIGYFEQQLVVARKSGGRSRESAALQNLSDAEGKLGDRRRADEYYEQYSVIAQERVDQALEALPRANSVFEMQQTVAEYPFMIDARFIGVLEKAIQIQIPTQAQPAFLQRLHALKQLARSPRVLSLKEMDERLEFLRADGDIDVYRDKLTGQEVCDDQHVRHNELYKNACDLIEGLLLGANQVSSPLTPDRRGRLERAIPLFEQVIEINPGNWPAMLDVGKVCQRLGDHERSFEWLSRAHRVNPHQPDVAIEAGFAAMGLGRNSEAVGFFERAVETSPQDGGHRAELNSLFSTHSLALALLFSDRPKDARVVAGEALHRMPSDQKAARIVEIIDEVLAGTRACPHHMRDLVEERASPASKPWWKAWKKS